MPHTLRGIRVSNENVAKLSMLCGYDDDLAKQATATSNRIRGLMTQIHPGPESVFGAHLDHPAMTALLMKYPTPKALRRAGKHLVEMMLAKHVPRAWKRWATAIFAALEKQTVVVAGTDAAGLVLPQLATSLTQTRTSRAEVFNRI